MPRGKQVFHAVDPKRTQGLFPRKYTVTRTDGSSEKGGKHENCRVFVLDLDHDPFARGALRAYIVACEEDYPVLARDLTKLLAQATASLPDAVKHPTALERAERRMLPQGFPTKSREGRKRKLVCR